MDNDATTTSQASNAGGASGANAPSAPAAQAPSAPAVQAAGAPGPGSTGTTTPKASAAGGEATSTQGTTGATSAPGAPATGTGEGGTGAPRKRRRGRRGGKRHKRKPAEGGAQGAQSGAEGGAQKTDGTEGGTAKPAASGGQRRAPAAKDDGAAGDGGAKPSQDVSGADKPAQEPRPRAPRQPRPEAKPKTEGEQADQGNGPEGASEGDGAPRPARRRRRGGRGRKRPAASGAAGAAASSDDEAKPAQPKPKAPAKPAAGGSTRLAARALRKEKQRQTRRPRRRLTEEDARRLRGEAKTMLVHEHDERTQIAVLEKGALIEHYVARRGQRSTMAGNIYLGRVQNVLAGMEAAFIDFGRGRNGVLYAGEVNYSAEDLEGELPRIEKVLKPGQALMVQVTKDPIGAKGARLTSQISLAGRYMVLAPEQKVSGISRRLAEGERTRLRQILRDIAPKDHGVIVRTAADGASHDALKRDLQNLLEIWEGIQKQAKKGKAPHALYEEPELTMRVVRDIFADDFEKVVVDSRRVYEEIRSYLDRTAPDLLDKLELFEGGLPVFEQYRVTEQLHKALQRKVWLPSGGSIVIDRTEAMTVIDVNTGKFTGKGSNLEETVYQNNLEAADEVARQLRLRDIGGIIVIDFIDMIDPKNQQELLRTLKRALSKDKTRSQVFEVSNLGLIEMTRKKVSEGLLDAFSDPCPNCEGRGIVMTHNID